MNENIVVVGATSEIAKALCEVLAQRGCGLVLVGRNQDELARSAADLRIRHAAAIAVEHFDVTDGVGFTTCWQKCLMHFTHKLNGIIVCHGVLPDQIEAQQDISLLRKSFEVNLLSVAAILEISAPYFVSRKSGFLAAISSVAGDRGRQSNYIYGAAKAGLSAYLQGMRNRLHISGVHVLTIKPGFVATRMSAGKVNPKSPLLASPQRVARDIDRAIRCRTNVLYTIPLWRLIMALICLIPESIFKRLRL